MQILVTKMKARNDHKKIEMDLKMKRQLEERVDCGKCNKSFKHNEHYDQSCDDTRE